MRRWLPLAMLLAGCTRVGSFPGRGGRPEELILADFEGSVEGFCSDDRVAFAFSRKKGVARGRSALAVPLPAVDYPGLYRKFERSDWSRYHCLRLDAFNPTMSRLQFCVRVDDAASRDYLTRFNRDAALYLEPGKNLIEIPLAQMARGGVNQRGIDLSRIRALHLFLARPGRPVRLIVDALRLVRFPRPPAPCAEILAAGGKRNWSAHEGTRAEETEIGVRFSPAGGGSPGLCIRGRWRLYGWDLIEVGYRTGASRHTLFLKLVTRSGETTNLATGVRGEGKVRLPVFLASDIPLDDAVEMHVFFSRGDCPREFELVSLKLLDLPEGLDTRVPAKGTCLVADFSALKDASRETAFGAWLRLPQGGGGERELVKTSYEKSVYAQTFTRESLRGMRVARSRDDAAVLVGYFLDRGAWHFATKEVTFVDGERAVVRFRRGEMGR